MKNLLHKNDLKFRWVNTTFPFTRPSLEMEIHSSSLFGEGSGNNNNEWLEVLGCGIVHQDILTRMGEPANRGMGWAFGIGLERIAMLYFGIPDIRAMWTRNEAFLAQFKEHGMNTKYRVLSPHPTLYRDISFWLYQAKEAEAKEEAEEEEAKEEASSLPLSNVQDSFKDCLAIAIPDWKSSVAQVQLIDRFESKKKSATSFCFRVTYQSHTGAMTQSHVDPMHDALAQTLRERYSNLELRI